MKTRWAPFLVLAAVLCCLPIACPAQIVLSPLPNGQISLTGTGLTGVPYTIQAATNLESPVWVSLAVTNAGTNGSFTFVDQDAANNSFRFYRAVPDTSFGRGITAKGSIYFSAGGHLDSYSVTNGVYDLIGTGQAAALTDSSPTGEIFMSGGYIAGYAYTGPTNGTISLSGDAAVGTEAFIASNTGIQAGHYYNNANFQFNDISAPVLGSFLTSFTLVGTTNYAGTAGQTTTYELATLTSSDSSKPLIVNGNTTIYLTQTGNNELVVSGSGYIKLMTNSTLTIYLAGNMTVDGEGIINGTGLAKNLSIYGLPSCTSIVYAGAANFIGVVDAPEASFIFSGSENAIGNFIVNTANVSGGSGIYWDSSLGCVQDSQ